MGDSTNRDPMRGEPAAAERAEQQRNADDWPQPGEEGYVHPDGTPQAEQQLADNRRAAADRAAAGSTVHGAPAANPGQDPGISAGIAEQRAADYSGPSDQDRQDAVTDYVREGLAAPTPAERVAGEREAAAPDQPERTRPTGRQRTAGDRTPRQER